MSTETKIQRKGYSSKALTIIKDTVQKQIPESRREEIRKFLELFGYKPEHTILQVHVAGYFGKGVRPPREIAARERAAVRYGGRTFVVVGRTHDPEILTKLTPPKKKQVSSPGYMGYLFKRKDKEGKAPDEILPLDFTPTSLNYPREWKDMYGTRGYLITMHVPSDFARKKNELNRQLRRIKSDVDVKKEWKFLDELEPYGYIATLSQEKKESDTCK